MPKIPKPLPKFLSPEDRDHVVDHLAGPNPTNARNLAIFCFFLCHGGHSHGGEETIGAPLSTRGIKLLFQRLSAKLGIKLHPHKLRHTFSTDFLNNGDSVADLQRMLGHESPQTWLYYAHVTNTDAVEPQKSNSVVDRHL